MQTDHERLTAIVERDWFSVVAREYGDVGVKLMRELVTAIRKIYAVTDPYIISGCLAVCVSVSGRDLIVDLGEPTVYSSPEYLVQDYDPASRSGITVIQLKDTRFLCWKELEKWNHSEQIDDAIIYVYESEKEFFYINGARVNIENPLNYSSLFAVPSFKELSAALEDYRSRFIRISTCPIFSSSWYGGTSSDRLFFRSAPEEVMRQSLTQYLKAVFRNAEVRPEQVVDETHPVDIKVTWMGTYRLALIEIKWLGKSLSDDGLRITQDFSVARANVGAKQLVDYLDANHRQAPVHQTVGYLVVIDGRRWGLNAQTNSVDRKKGMYFRDCEIKYTPEYDKIRPDFMKPVRMFAEPICR